MADELNSTTPTESDRITCSGWNSDGSPCPNNKEGIHEHDAEFAAVFGRVPAKTADELDKVLFRGVEIPECPSDFVRTRGREVQKHSCAVRVYAIYPTVS